MRNNVYFLYPSAGLELTIPPGAAPDDSFQPVRICDESLRKICIHKEDILYAQLNLRPPDGRFSYVEARQEILLGFVFAKPGGVVKVESLCHAPCCPPQYFELPELVTVAPITWLVRHRNGITSKFVFDERRSELWET